MKVALIRKISKENMEKVRKYADITNGYDAEVALVESTFPDFSKYKKLRWMHASYVGMDKILNDEIRKSRVIVTNSRGMQTPVPEHALALMLAFNRRLNDAFRAQKNSSWNRQDIWNHTTNTVGEMRGKTVGILGLGAIGLEVARLSKAFGCRVIGTNREPVKSGHVDKVFAGKNLSDMLKEADYVVSCLPLTKETHHLLGKEQFKSMKKTAVVVNVGRGPVIDEPALIAALRKKHLAGACLDVFEGEPLPASSPLWKMKNVIITCHYAAWTPHYEDRVIEIFCKNLKAFKSGKKLVNVVDKKRGY